MTLARKRIARLMRESRSAAADVNRARDALSAAENRSRKAGERLVDAIGRYVSSRR